MNRPDMVKNGLADGSADVRKAALIALDQMQNSTLKAGQVTPFLASNDSTMESTARWVVSHHPEWAGSMITYLRNQLSKSKLEAGERKQLKDILVSYCGDASMQQFMLTQMAGASVEKKLFILEAINACNIEEVPSGWVNQLGKELTSNVDEIVKLNALKVIRLHSIASLNDALEKVADNDKNTPALRISAIGTSINDSTQLSIKHFDYLYAQLQPGNEASIRQQAAGVLGQAKLSNELLLKLAKDFLGKADAFILPRLLPVFQGANEIEIGKSLASALENSPSLDNITEEYLRETFSKYPPELSTTTEKLMTKLKEVRGDRLARIHSIENNITKVTLSAEGCCSLVKQFVIPVMQSVRKVVPSVPTLRLSSAIVQHMTLLKRSSILVLVLSGNMKRIKSKRRITCILELFRNKRGMIRLGISPLESVQIQRKDIISTEIQNVSMMPLGLDKLVTEQEMADLMAFLLGQDQDPDTDAELLR